MTPDSLRDAPVLTPIPYLPRVSWFVTLLSNSTVRWHTGELYDKRRPRNRCKIATAKGPQELSVPLINGRSQRMPLDRVQPLYNGKWQREHMHALQTAYGRTPYFQYYADGLFDILNAEHESLASLNLSLIRAMLKNFRTNVNEVSDAATRPFSGNALPDDFTYRQVFGDRTGFVKDCSGVDLLFNHGPDASAILNKALLA